MYPASRLHSVRPGRTETMNFGRWTLAVGALCSMGCAVADAGQLPTETKRPADPTEDTLFPVNAGADGPATSRGSTCPPRPRAPSYGHADYDIALERVVHADCRVTFSIWGVGRERPGLLEVHERWTVDPASGAFRPSANGTRRDILEEET